MLKRKFDSGFIFIPSERPFDRQEIERRIKQIVSTDPERTAYVAIAEDTVLTKLERFREGNEASERQWRDVLGILKAQEGQMEMDYPGDGGVSWEWRNCWKEPSGRSERKDEIHACDISLCSDGTYSQK